MKYKISRRSAHLKGEISLAPTKSVGNKMLVLRVLKNSSITQRIANEHEDALMVNERMFANGKRGGVYRGVRYARAVLNYFGGDWLISSSDIIKGKAAQKFVKILNQSGIRIGYEKREGQPPIRVVGKNVRGNVIRVDGSINSKMAEIRFIFPSNSPVEALFQLRDTIYKTNYINMSLKALQRLGVNTEWDSQEVLIEQEVIDGSELHLEADWSLVSYWYLWATLLRRSELTIAGLSLDDIQPDMAVKELFDGFFGIRTIRNSKGITLLRDGKPKGSFIHNFTNYPNLIPAVAVACVGKGIPFIIGGIESLRQREMDRIEALQRELRRVGAQIEIMSTDKGETINFNGHSDIENIKEVEFNTYDDGRLALALVAFSALGINITLKNPLVVNKSYLNFWDEAIRLGLIYAHE